jgi:hypothetical protein
MDCMVGSCPLGLNGTQCHEPGRGRQVLSGPGVPLPLASIKVGAGLNHQLERRRIPRGGGNGIAPRPKPKSMPKPKPSHEATTPVHDHGGVRVVGEPVGLASLQGSMKALATTQCHCHWRKVVHTTDHDGARGTGTAATIGVQAPWEPVSAGTEQSPRCCMVQGKGGQQPGGQRGRGKAARRPSGSGPGGAVRLPVTSRHHWGPTPNLGPG